MIAMIVGCSMFPWKSDGLADLFRNSLVGFAAEEKKVDVSMS
jgi:hypothetical protein